MKIKWKILTFGVWTLQEAWVTNALALPTDHFFQEKTNSLSLSDLLSSPERYANSLNMTIDEVKATKKLHQQASEDLHFRLQKEDLSGADKHAMMCKHRLKYGRHPFVCRECWSYLPVCVCGLAENKKASLPENLDVIVWTHHREWGLTSNTGCILGLTLDNCTLLMKGLPEHDNQMEEVIGDDSCLPVVLWPGDQQSNTTKTMTRTISLDEVKSELKQRRVVLIAVDGTWRNARKMVARLPPNVLRLDLSADIVYSQSDQRPGESILAPLRTKGPSDGEENDRQVCTAEAVVGALANLGLASNDSQHALNVTRQKVDLIRRYRGKF